MLTKLLILSILCPFLNCQQRNSNNGAVYFPEDNESKAASFPYPSFPLPSNVSLSEIRGTTEYEKYVDTIIAGGIANLTLSINKALLSRSSYSKNNVVFAPMSIGGALALVLLGSNGKTFEEITNVLGLAADQEIQSKSDIVHEQFGRLLRKLESTSGFELGSQVTFAHAVFVQKTFPIRRLYKQMAEALYESDVVGVDFENNPNTAQDEINTWVATRTMGKIKDILGDVPLQSTKVIIASAMYFKALWEKPFFEGTTVRRPFYTNGRDSPATIEADMMANGGFFPYFKDVQLKCEIMGFPYKGNATMMYVVMPFGSNTETLKRLESIITPGDLEYLADNTKDTSAVVLFPRMKIESTVDLRAPLEKLGLKSLFNPAEANLALLSPGPGRLQLPSKFLDNNNQPITGTAVNQNTGSVVIFSRNSELNNCSYIFNYSKYNCNTTNNVVYTRSGRPTDIKVASRVSSGPVENDSDTIDNLRKLINQQSVNSNQNPGLFADKIIHKVYMDITETGTEAAASTTVSLSRDGSRVTFRVDVPFFFFIRHEQTKSILFWGSVNEPTPNYKKL